jgi:hypothetical protein
LSTKIIHEVGKQSGHHSDVHAIDENHSDGEMLGVESLKQSLQLIVDEVESLLMRLFVEHSNKVDTDVGENYKEEDSY